MQKVSLKKLSILGLVLLAASAVTAAIAPKSNTDSAKFVEVDSATASTNGGLTCSQTVVEENQEKQTCDFTADSGTTDGIVASSDGIGGNTTEV